MRSSPPTSSLRSLTSGSGSLACLQEEDSESSECAEAESFEDIVEEAVVGLAACIYEQHKDGEQNACILAAESVFQVDDALSWLECMTMPNVMENSTPEVRWSFTMAMMSPFKPGSLCVAYTPMHTCLQTRTYQDTHAHGHT